MLPTIRLVRLMLNDSLEGYWPLRRIPTESNVTADTVIRAMLGSV